jgi:caffeoyl-CoA O-methyltransferase
MADPVAAPKSFLLTPELAEYLVGHGSPPDAVQLALIAETRELGAVAGMQIAPEQGAFLTLMTQVVGAKSAVEVGTFTGYSSLCIARGLAAGGRLLCCDVSDEWTTVARRAWERAGVADRIDLRLAPAADTLRSLPPDETIDIAFIDADKPSYGVY